MQLSLFEEYQELENVPSHFLREVEHFFSTYKQLEGVSVQAQGWDKAEAAIEEVKASLGRMKAQSG
jgi:inorganic pyrophosphatase